LLAFENFRLLLLASSLVCGPRLPSCITMAPLRTMTGDTFTDEKTPQSPVSPVSPTNTDATLTGDFIESVEDSQSTIQPSVRADSIDVESAQPGMRSHKILFGPQNLLAPQSMGAKKVSSATQSSCLKELATISLRVHDIAMGYHTKSTAPEVRDLA